MVFNRPAIKKFLESPSRSSSPANQRSETPSIIIQKVILYLNTMTSYLTKTLTAIWTQKERLSSNTEQRPSRNTGRVYSWMGGRAKREEPIFIKYAHSISFYWNQIQVNYPLLEIGNSVSMRIRLQLSTSIRTENQTSVFLTLQFKSLMRHPTPQMPFMQILNLGKETLRSQQYLNFAQVFYFIKFILSKSSVSSVVPSFEI